MIESYCRIPMHPKGADVSRCIFCNNHLEPGIIQVHLYDNHNVYVKDKKFVVDKCNYCDLGYATKDTIDSVRKVKGLHAKYFTLSTKVISLEKTIKKINDDYTPIKEKKQKNKRLSKEESRALFKEYGFVFPEETRKEIAKITVPDGSTIFVGIKERHECSGKMIGSLWREKRALVYKGKVFSDNLMKCARCSKLFISEEEYYSKAQIPPNYQFVEENPATSQFSVNDSFVKVSLRKCYFGNHRLKDIKCCIPVTPFGGGVIRVEVLAAYCCLCNTYYILESEYKKLCQYGKILCRVFDEKQRELQHSNYTNEYNLNEESLLHIIGYNVSSSNNLTHLKRCRILESAIDANVLTRAQICSHLDYLIRRSSNRSNYDDAISKWEMDREYIAHYKNDELESVKVSAIVK